MTPSPSTAARTPVRHGVLFGLLSMLGPLAIDLYLPAFPAMAADLGTGPGPVQLSLAAYILALAIGPLTFGTLSDRLGRRPVLFAAMTIFGTTSILCALAPSIFVLIALRVLQGLGACGMTVMSRAMVRDVARDHAAAKLLALALLVQSISPLFAPALGGALLTVMSWRGLFVLIALLTLAVAGVVGRLLPETAPPTPAAQHLASWRIYGSLLGNPRYIGMCLLAGCATAGGFGFLTAAPFVMSRQFGLSEHAIGLILTGLGLFQVAATQVSPRLLRARGVVRHLATTTAVGLALATALGLSSTMVPPVPILLLVPLAGLFAVYGLMLTPAAVGAMDAADGHSGAAAALLATVQLSAAALVSLLLSAVSSRSLGPLVLATLIAMAIATTAAWTLRSGRMT